MNFVGFFLGSFLSCSIYFVIDKHSGVECTVVGNDMKQVVEDRYD